MIDDVVEELLWWFHSKACLLILWFFSYIRGSSERGYRLQSAAMINITHGARKNGAMKEPKLMSKVNKQSIGQSQKSNNFSGGQYQSKQQPCYSGNQNKYNSYAEASRGSQGSYTSLRNRNDNQGYFEDSYGMGQRNSHRQGNYGGRGYSGDYQANIDYDGYNDRVSYSDSPRGRPVANNSDGGWRKENGSRDVRQQQKEESKRENLLRSQQGQSQVRGHILSECTFMRNIVPFAKQCIGDILNSCWILRNLL